MNTRFDTRLIATPVSSMLTLLVGLSTCVQRKCTMHSIVHLYLFPLHPFIYLFITVPTASFQGITVGGGGEEKIEICAKYRQNRNII